MEPDNQALKMYYQRIATERRRDTVDLSNPTELILNMQVEKKKKRHKPPYARCKLACKFHNKWKAHLPSYDYFPRENYHERNPDRVLDEGDGLRRLINKAKEWNELGRLEIATLFVSITIETYTGAKNYDLALAHWGSHIPTIVRHWKLIECKRELIVEKPIYAKVESLLDLPFLINSYKDDLLLDQSEKYY